jgi:hypothetical protein
LFLQYCLGIDYERQSTYDFHIIAEDNAGLSTRVPVTIHIENRNDFCPEILNYTSVLFFNTDLENNPSLNSFFIELIDGDNDTCTIDLLNFHELLRLELIEHNHYRLDVYGILEREYYIVQLRLQDVVNETTDQSCIRYMQYILMTGNNRTNQTMAIDIARDYLQALQFVQQHRYSSFHLTLIHIICIVCFCSLILCFLTLITMKIVCYATKPTENEQRTRTIYRCQGSNDTQLPLLDHQSVESSLIVRTRHQCDASDQHQQQVNDDDRIASCEC